LSELGQGLNNLFKRGAEAVTPFRKPPQGYKYTREHEWICPEGENKGKVGLADYAQFHLGDIVFLDLPTPGTQVVQSKKMGEIESVKAVTDLFAPASGCVLEINQTNVDEPTLVNQDPYGAGWLVRLELSQPAELDNLMDSDEYDRFVADQSESDAE
jgi:glycine cleavage system H protein